MIWPDHPNHPTYYYVPVFSSSQCDLLQKSTSTWKNRLRGCPGVTLLPTLGCNGIPQQSKLQSVQKGKEVIGTVELWVSGDEKTQCPGPGNMSG